MLYHLLDTLTSFKALLQTSNIFCAVAVYVCLAPVTKKIQENVKRDKNWRGEKVNLKAIGRFAKKVRNIAQRQSKILSSSFYWKVFNIRAYALTVFSSGTRLTIVQNAVWDDQGGMFKKLFSW